MIAYIPIALVVATLIWASYGVRGRGGNVDNYTLLRGIRDREERARLKALNGFLHHPRKNKK